jgi:plasmid stabilization system protein ParE
VTIRTITFEKLSFELGQRARFVREALASADETCQLIEDLVALHTADNTEIARQLFETGSEAPTAAQEQLVQDLRDGAAELCEVAKAGRGVSATTNANREQIIRRIARRP